MEQENDQSESSNFERPGRVRSSKAFSSSENYNSPGSFNKASSKVEMPDLAEETGDEPASYDISKTKEIAATLKKILNGLIEKYHAWYSIAETKDESVFGNAILKLQKTVDDILNHKENSHPSLNSTMLTNLALANMAALKLNTGYESTADKNIIQQFQHLISWATDMTQLSMNGRSKLVTDYVPDSIPPVDPPSSAAPPVNPPTPPSPPPPPSTPTVDFKTMRGRLLSDHSTENDLLGFPVFTTAIAELIRSNIQELDTTKQTQPSTDRPLDTKMGKPFNIGIIAPWGHGKTTLMKHIQKELDPGYKHSDEEIEMKIKREDNNTSNKTTTYQQAKKYMDGQDLENKENISSSFPSIWFNAWRYQSSEQIWAGLGHAIITQLSTRLSPIEQEKFWFKLQLSRVDTLKMRKEFYADLIKKTLPWIMGSCLALVAALICLIYKAWEASTAIAALGVIPTVIKCFTSTRDKIDGKVAVYFEEPDYAEKLGVYHHIINDLHKVFSLVLKENQRAVIFIDDLDRCSPNVIGEVFEAVNLMMIDPVIGKHCYFIFGMDAQVVAAALDNKYALMNGKLKEQEDAFGSVGWYFLDKFIQLPFNVPIMSQDERLNMFRYYFEPETTTPIVNIEKDQAISDVRQAMQETNAGEKKKKLSAVLNSIDDKNVEVKKEAVKEAVKEKLKDDDSGDIVGQLQFISPFLSSSPREIIRYINLLRFFNSTLYIRQIMVPGSVQTGFKGIAKYLLIALRWPQLVRWIQWEGDDELVMYNTTRDKARFLDELISSFRTTNIILVDDYTSLKNEPIPDEAQVQKSTEDLYNIWSKHCEVRLKYDEEKKLPKKLAWLYDKQIMEVLIHNDTLESTFEKALACKMW